ncbi:MAG: excisionase family DNA-binding protein [Alphaproteobacteria bacterium]|nr:excisionase family DNA-binding protein [Alphaproteobacteria bacterium]
MVSQIEPLLVPVNDGAKIIGAGRSKFYELVAEGKIPLIKLGRKSLVSVAALKEFADSLNTKIAA